MRLRSFLVLLSLGFVSALGLRSQECTAAVISPAMGEGRRPMLWKNRDTGELSNRVVYVKEKPYGYLAVVDKDDPSGRICWAGLNEAGFAIMNTATYNLPQRKGDALDQDGLVMAQALRTCRSVEEFEAFLTANLGPNLGVSCNYGVIDASGRAWLFEVHNHGFEKFDASAAPEKFLLVTNYSRSGERDAGAGYLRMDRAQELAKRRAPGPFSAREIFRDFARDTGHSLLDSPTWREFKGFNAPHWIHTKHTINRWDTACSIVLVGKDPGDPRSQAVMWILPGEPLVSTALPLFVGAGSSPDPFWRGKEAPLWAETLRLKARVRPALDIPEKQEYLEASRLDNHAGSGFLPLLLRTEEETFERTAAFLQQSRSPEELAGFQADLAGKVLLALKGIR